MAEKLLLFYKHISDMKGLEGKMKLAQETKVPSSKAAIEPDTEANIDLFRRAFESITGNKSPIV